MKKYFLYLYSLLSYLNPSFSQVNYDSVQAESMALSFFREELIERERILEFNGGILRNYFINSTNLLSATSIFYTSGKICTLSRLDKLEDEYLDESKIIQGFEQDRKDKEASGLTSSSLVIPPNMKKVNLNNFKSLEGTNNFFINVGYHLKYNDNYLVEINLTTINELPNLSQYIFQFYLNKDFQVTEWNFLEGYYPVPTENSCF